MNNIQTLLPVHPIYEIGYRETIEAGKRHLEGKRIVFSILARDAGPYIAKNIEKMLLWCGEIVSSCNIVIYENDSKDDTKLELIRISEKHNTKIHVNSSDRGAKKFGPVKSNERVTALAEYRNDNLLYIKNQFADTDYVIVSDIDFIDFSQDGLFHSFGLFETSQPKLDAICGNSFTLHHTTNGLYIWNYDSWAYRPTWWHDITINDNKLIPHHSMQWFGGWFPPVGSPATLINSGFGGMCIYKTNQYIKGKYEGFDCEHVTFNWKLSNIIDNFSLALNPAQRMLLL